MITASDLIGWTANTLLETIHQPQTFTLVAHCITKDIPIGIICAQVVLDSIDIVMLITDANYRRQGIATELITALENSCPQTTLFLEVESTNTIAQKLYEKIGFIRSGGRKNYYIRGKNTADAIYYMKENKVSRNEMRDMIIRKE